jgi:hypothetical protein
MNISLTDADLVNAVAMGIGAAHAEGTPAGKRLKDALDRGDFNPMKNTDQALDVATVHKIQVNIAKGVVLASFLGHVATDDINTDSAAAVRRVIVLVSAGLGEQQS